MLNSISLNTNQAQNVVHLSQAPAENAQNVVHLSQAPAENAQNIVHLSQAPQNSLQDTANAIKQAYDGGVDGSLLYPVPTQVRKVSKGELLAILRQLQPGTLNQANEVEQANETEPAVAKPVKKSKILSAFEYILRFLFRH